jgi:N-acetylglucosaminyldiphosphoundecaprenol N-acetyl-beta-D-mannosaminyltransferase
MQTFHRNETSFLKTDRFELWYQPVYDLPEGTVIHNEILLRWRALNGKLKSPKDFMLSIFQSGQEQWLDRFVLQSAVRVLDDKPKSELSINLSREATEDLQIASFIHDLTSEFCVKPSRLHIELSEKSISKDIKSYISLIKDLKEVGCTVVLDNFSNDYLTFVQWESLGVDFVKIRGELIHQSAHDIRAKSLLQAIVENSCSIDQLTVAKSIDAVGTSLSLDKFRFGSAQGYHLKPPSPDLCLTGRVEILGVSIDNLSMEELLENLDSGTIFTPNVDHIINTRKHKEFGKAYSVADYKLCDSQILYFASQFLGHPLKERISGSDLFPAFYEHHKNDLNTSIFLLGGMGDVPLRAQRNINQKVGRRMVVDAYSPPLGFDEDEALCEQIIQRINQSEATVLVVGLGAPKQEKWISQYRQELTSAKIIFAIGATIDFEAGVVPRAPQMVSNLGGEWLYRLAMEPKRLWKRYLINDVPFVWLLLKQKIFG